MWDVCLWSHKGGEGGGVMFSQPHCLAGDRRVSIDERRMRRDQIGGGRGKGCGNRITHVCDCERQARDIQMKVDNRRRKRRKRRRRWLGNKEDQAATV